MKKRLLSLVLSISLVLSLLSVSNVCSYAAEELYAYKILSASNKTIEITKYNGTEESVVIPQSIDGYTVASLSSSSFIDNSSIKILNIPATINNISCYFNSPNIEEINVSESNCYYSSKDGVLYDKAKETLIRCPYNYQQGTFVVPETVKVIGSNAFKTDASTSKTYTSMLNIEINEGVEELQDAAFSNTRFKEIILPDSVKKIGNCAFSGTLAQKIHFGSGVEKIGKQMFTTQSGSRTPRLSKITVSPDNKIFCAIDGVLYGNYGRDLVVYPQNKNDVKEYKIPDGVMYIHSCALQACGFDKVDLNNVTEIAENAFMNSTVKNFIIPECLNDFYYNAATTGIEFTVLNPSCNFRVSYFDYGAHNYKYSITVKAYENSTAQAFVNNNSNSDVAYTFISLGKYGESSGGSEPTIPDETDTPTDTDNIGNSDYSYSFISDDTVKIEAYHGSDTDLLIPSAIDGYTVKEIGNSVFESGELTSVIIPDTVCNIGRYAFYNCSRLKRVTMPCSAEIMSKAFSGCNSVEKVIITSGDGQMTNYSSDPLLLDKDNSFMQTPWYKTKEKVDVVLCNDVKSIGNYAFYRCSNVQSVTVPKTVNSLGLRAFYYNKTLQSVVVSPDNLSYCDVDGVLYSKDMSTLVVYPAGKTDASYNVTDNTINISDYAFSFCQSLSVLNFSCSVSNVGALSIYDCEALKQVNVPENNDAYYSSDGVLYSKDKSTLVYYPSGKEDKEFLMLPDTTAIGERAVCFTKLESVKISQGVTKIGSYAFCSNKGVSEIFVPNSVEYVDSNAFYLCASLVKITICSYDCEFNGKCIPDSATIYTCSGSTAQMYSEKYGNPVVSIGHNYVDKVNSSCVEEGYVTKVCSVCGDSYETDELKTAGHQYTEKVINPTCTQQGYTVFTCSKCKDVYIDNYTEPLKHNTVTDKAIPATCISDGKTEGSHCTRCNRIFVAQQTVKATGHSYDNGVVKVKATCTQSGKKIFTCTKCSHSYSKTIAAVGHNYRTKVTRATFDQSGSCVNYCSICGIVKSKKQIPKIKSIKLSRISYTYTGENLAKPAIAVKDNNGYMISRSNYTVTYISRSTGKSVANIKGIGQYKVKVVFKGNYSGTKYLYFCVKPKNIAIKMPSTGSRYVTAKWTKDSSVSGYQAVIATNSSFTKNSRTVTIGKDSVSSYKFTKLKKGTRYYIKVRSYKNIKVDGKSAKMYSNYSSVKSIICK